MANSLPSFSYVLDTNSTVQYELTEETPITLLGSSGPIELPIIQTNDTAIESLKFRWDRYVCIFGIKVFNFSANTVFGRAAALGESP